MAACERVGKRGEELYSSFWGGGGHCGAATLGGDEGRGSYIASAVEAGEALGENKDVASLGRAAAVAASGRGVRDGAQLGQPYMKVPTSAPNMVMIQAE